MIDQQSASPTRTFVLQAFGLKPNELNVLKSLCTLSSHQTRAHTLRMAEDSEEPDALIVDLDDAQAQGNLADGRDIKPTVYVTAHDSKLGSGKRVLKRPILASRLLAMIDGAVSAFHSNLRPAAARGPVPVAAAPLQAPPPEQTVLVVDDSPTVQKHLEVVLRELGAGVVCAASGEAALERLMERSFDLVLLDVVLPGTDGYQVCKAIKKSLERKHMPVVMLTSKSSPFDRIRGTLAGCDTYLTKPVDRAQLKAIADRYLRQSAQRAAANPRDAAGPRDAAASRAAGIAA